MITSRNKIINIC